MSLYSTFLYRFMEQENPVENLVHFLTHVAPGIQSIGSRHQSVLAVLRFNFSSLARAEELLDNQEFLATFGIIARRDTSKMIILEIPYEMSESEVLVSFLLTEMHDWQYVGTAEVKSRVAPSGSTSIVSQISDRIEPPMQEKYFRKLPLYSRLHHLKEFVKFPTKKGAS